jgi:hypothetical protein
MDIIWLIIGVVIAAIVWPPLRIPSRLSREEEEKIRRLELEEIDKEEI